MYRRSNQSSITPENFELPFAEKLSPDNRWVIMDEKVRNAIEGKFGQAKRLTSLNCIMAKLPETSETSIALTFLVINLSTLLRQVNCLFLSLFLHPSKLGNYEEFFDNDNRILEG